MKRTTIVLDNALLQNIKAEAARAGKSFKDYVSETLKWALSQRKKPSSFKLRWQTVKGKRPPRVSIDDRDRLYDFLDEN